MPPIRSVSINDNDVTINDVRGGNARKFNFNALSAGDNTVELAEASINSALTVLSGGLYGIECHVFTIRPLSLTITTYDIGTQPRKNWWIIRG